MTRYLWVKDDPPGMEHADLEFGLGGLVGTSTAFGALPVPYRVDFDLVVGADWITQRLALTASGADWTRSLILERDASGSWTGSRSTDGAAPPTSAASTPAGTVEPTEIPAHVVDVDIQQSPLTNLMPVRRLGLDRPAPSAALTMAWVSVPSLAVTLDEQRYTLLGVDDGDVCVRYESGSGFFAVGVARDYPGIARRLG